MGVKIKVNTRQIWKLQLSQFPDYGARILVYDESRKFTHELEATAAPHLVDYIRDDDRWNGQKTYVWGFIEDGLLVIEERAPDPGW